MTTLSNTPSGKSREEILHNAITDNNDVIPEKYDKTILSAMKQAQEAAVDEALRQVFKLCRIDDIATDTMEQLKKPEEFLKAKILEKLK